MTETRPVFLTLASTPVFFDMNEIPTNEKIKENIDKAAELLSSKKERKPVSLNVYGEKVPGLLFVDEGFNFVITDGFMAILGEDKFATLIMPFTFFYRR